MRQTRPADRRNPGSGARGTLRPAPALLAVLLALAPAAAQTRQTLIFARGSDATSLDPYFAEEGESVKVVDCIYEPLVTFAEASTEIRPCLATRWEISDDKLTWTFHIREGVKFHDGTPLNADAVVFSLNRILDPKNEFRFGRVSAFGELYSDIASVEAADAMTVRVRTKSPSVVTLANLAMFPAAIVSPTAVRKHGVNFEQEPSGTGPFMLHKWQRHKRLALRANKDYWGGAPRLEQVIFTEVPDNAARRQQLEKGEIHLTDNLSPVDLTGLRGNANVVVDVIPGINFGYLGFNVRKPPMDDLRVRQAIAHAIDKPKILKLAYRELATTGPNPVPPSMWSYNDKVEDYAYDPVRARAMLKESGADLSAAIELWAMTAPRPYMPQPDEVAQVIKACLTEVGLNVTIVQKEWGTYLRETKNGQHHLFLMGWTSDNGDPDNFLDAILGRNSIGQLNLTWWDHPEYNRLIAAARVAFDQPERTRLYHEAQELIHRETPIMIVAYMPATAAYRRSVKGFVLHPMQIFRFEKVWIE
ncbi:MAG: Periplasmic dipeptide transport protein [Phycisphaerae bacterium]|nr:Periplasmic dipeptide transport protein [Phycisphaerae bacterium]